MLETLNHLDTQLFLFLNGIHSPFWDNVMWWISGKKEWIPLYLILLAALIYRFKRKTLVILIFVALAITLSDQLAVRLFKDVFHRLRPCHNPDIQSMVHILRNHCGGLYGFISNHAANTFCLAAYLTHIFRNRYFSWFMYVWAAIVSYSRIYLGVHYPGDIIGGALFGILVGWLVYRLYLVTIRKLMQLKPDWFKK